MVTYWFLIWTFTLFSISVLSFNQNHQLFCVFFFIFDLYSYLNILQLKFGFFPQHVDEENSYLCGYLQINGLTEEYPKLTTFFDGEIISQKYPFLTRKWDADEEVDRKHWVIKLGLTFCSVWVMYVNNFSVKILPI